MQDNGGVHSEVPGASREPGPVAQVPFPTREVAGKSQAARIARVLVHYLGRIVGKRNALTAPELSRLVGLRPTATCQPLRQAAKILLCDETVPLVSCSKGFYVATARDELYEYRENLMRRIAGLGRDVEAVDVILRKGNILENVELEKKQKQLFQPQIAP